MGALERYFELTQANAQQQKPGHILGYNVPASTARMNPFMDNGSSQPQQQPQVDTADPINSLAGMLVTPAEREAQEQKLLKNKRRMIAWTGLFDGLRNLANLYAVSKGAAPMKFTDNPYQAIEQGYQQEHKRLDDVQKNRENYAKQIWSLRRQASDDARKNALSAAQARWYDTRDEMARLKGENDRLKAEQQASVNEARRKQIETKTKQMEDLHPLMKQKLEAVIKKTLHDANRPYGRSGGGSGRGRSSSSSGIDPYEELARQLNENPDVIGPILQQEGLGFYDPDTKEFNFSKNVTKGMATTANKRASGKRTSSNRGNLLPGGGNGKKNNKQGGSLLPK